MNKIKLYLSKLDFVDEFISIRLQRIRYIYDSHLKYQRRYQYGKAFVRTILGIGIIISQAQVLHQSTFSFYRPYDLCAELLSDSQDNETRIFHAIDDVLSKGTKIGELDALSYLTIGTLFAQAQHPDLSQTAFYMAHLKDHKKVFANSDLQYETNTKA